MSDKLESAFRLEMARDGQSHLFAELVYMYHVYSKKNEESNQIIRRKVYIPIYDN